MDFLRCASGLERFSNNYLLCCKVFRPDTDQGGVVVISTYICLGFVSSTPPPPEHTALAHPHSPFSIEGPKRWVEGGMCGFCLTTIHTTLGLLHCHLPLWYSLVLVAVTPSSLHCNVLHRAGTVVHCGVNCARQL